jgi:hypothetical protein
MSALVSDIVSAVITELSQVPGIATQIYSADRILQHVQDAFLLEFETFWWPDYCAYIGPIALDGTTGSLTADLAGPLGNVNEYRDVGAVWPSDSSRKLRELPQGINPFTLTGGNSTGGWYITPDSTTNRPFKVFPITSTGSVVVFARQRPTLPLATTDTLRIDSLLLQYDAAWMYTVDDGTVPAQVNKFQTLAANRRKAVYASYAQHPLDLDPRMPMYGDSDFFTVVP